MAYTLGQAAAATGKQKSTLLKALNSGRLSGRKNEKGEWDIDPAELHRVYPPVSRAGSPDGHRERQETPPDARGELIGLRVKVEALQHQLEREQDTVRDLRCRLDQEGEERRRLTWMLTDQREKASETASASAPPKPGEGFLARLRFVLTGKA